MKKGKIAIAAVIVYFIVALGVYCGRVNFSNTTDYTGNESVEYIDNTKDVIDEQQVIVDNDATTDIISRHALPALERMEKDDQDKYVNDLQVMRKIEQLGLDTKDFLCPEISISNIEDAVKTLNNINYGDRERIVFDGATSQELQQAIEDNPNAVIDICSEQISISDTIVLPNNTVINGNGVKLTGKDLKYGFIGENVSDICIDNICMDGNVEYGIYLIDCDNIKITGSQINGCLQKAICIIGTTDKFIISNNKMLNNQAGALYMAGDVSNGLVESNSVENSYGTSNMMAGIVFTSDNPRNKRDIWDNFDDMHRGSYRENLYGQTKAPHNIIVRNNLVFHSNSSGIYSDGAYNCFVIGNKVKQNDKEGMCLDHGTIGFYLKGNVFEANGQRRRQTDDDLRMDFVLESGRMDDGTAKSKLPGVSLDNTAYNILEDNMVINNYGGGIKMVRTTVRTLVMRNIIRDNNMGQNDSFHFFGIEVGAAPSGVESSIMDFTPDYENIVCRNIITGNHYSGVFIGEECYVNDVFDNIIMDSQAFGVEAISLKFNSIMNNVTNCGVRNEFK